MTDRDLVAETVAPRELADWLLSRGQHWVTTAEAAALLGIPSGHVAPSLAAYRRRGHLFSPTKGLYVAIPPEFRSWGAVPASHFIDALMAHLGHDYYVCLLSAAEVHGFAHQRPQVFQVMTQARLRDRSFGRVHLAFVTSVHTADRPVQEVNTPTGTMRVSTPETTVLDLVTFPNLSGSLFNVATVIGDMLIDGAIDTHRLSEVAAGYPTATVQRTGWLIDVMARDVGVEVDTDPLVPLASARATPTLLDRGGGRWGDHDERWNVIANQELEGES